MSFAHVSSPIRAVTRQTFARKFITLGRVINLWDQVVGPDLALKTYPIGMSIRKKTKKSGAEQGAHQTPMTKTEIESILEIAASSADATLLHYQKNLILERLANLLGARMIVDLKITHAGPRPGISAMGARDLRPKPSLDEKVPDDQDPLETALKNLHGAVTKSGFTTKE